MRESWGRDVQHGGCGHRHCVLCLRVAERVNLKRSHQKKKNEFVAM